MNFWRSISSFLSQGFLEFNCSKPQSFTKSQYNWYTVAALDMMTTRHSHPTLPSFSYATLAPAANIADTYFPRFTRWLVCPSSNHLLAHYTNPLRSLLFSLEWTRIRNSFKVSHRVNIQFGPSCIFQRPIYILTLFHIYICVCFTKEPYLHCSPVIW